MNKVTLLFERNDDGVLVVIYGDYYGNGETEILDMIKTDKEDADLWSKLITTKMTRKIPFYNTNIECAGETVFVSFNEDEQDVELHYFIKTMLEKTLKPD